MENKKNEVLEKRDNIINRHKELLFKRGDSFYGYQNSSIYNVIEEGLNKKEKFSQDPQQLNEIIYNRCAYFVDFFIRDSVNILMNMKAFKEDHSHREYLYDYIHKNYFNQMMIDIASIAPFDDINILRESIGLNSLKTATSIYNIYMNVIVGPLYLSREDQKTIYNKCIAISNLYIKIMYEALTIRVNFYDKFSDHITPEQREKELNNYPFFLKEIINIDKTLDMKYITTDTFNE